MTFLEKSLNNLPEDIKAELSDAQELSLEDLDMVAGGGDTNIGSPTDCCICHDKTGIKKHSDGHYYCDECAKCVYSITTGINY